MRTLRSFLARVRGLLRSRHLDRELDDELAFHLQMHIDDNRRLGMSAVEARRDALIRLGGVEQVKSTYRDRRGIPVLETTLQDLRFALRLMRRSPGFSAVVLLTLAIGIGANTVMFSIVNTLLLRPLPYREPDRLVSVQTVDGTGRRPYATAPPDFYTYRKETRTLEQLEAYYTGPYNLTGGLDPERLPTLTVSSGFFDALGTPPAIGLGGFIRRKGNGAGDSRRHRHVWALAAPFRRRAESHRSVDHPERSAFRRGRTICRASSRSSVSTRSSSPYHGFRAGRPHELTAIILRMFGRLRPDVSREQANDDLAAISKSIVAERNPSATVRC